VSEETPHHGDEKNRRWERHVLGPGHTSEGSYSDRWCGRCRAWRTRQPGIVSMLTFNLCCPVCNIGWTEDPAVSLLPVPCAHRYGSDAAARSVINGIICVEIGMYYIREGKHYAGRLFLKDAIEALSP
jgi:hypothetical protein